MTDRGSDSELVGRVLDAGLSMLDRQVVGRKGRMAGNVDDIELTSPDEPGGPLVVTAILQGPLALGPRLGGRLGVWWTAIARRLHPAEDPQPCRIPFALVSDISTVVTVAADADELEVARLEHWVRDHFIAKIPGAGDAPE
jgi:hypothetical protein